MNAEWVGELLRGKAITVAGWWRMWDMGSDEDEDDRHGKMSSKCEVHCLELNALQSQASIHEHTLFNGRT